MQVDNWELISRAEFPELPPELERIFDKLNGHLELLTTAVQNHLTLSENLNAEIIELDLNNNVSTKVKLQRLRGKPTSAFLIYTQLFDYAKFAWEVVDEDEVNIKVSWDSAPSTPVTVKIAFLGA